MTHTRRTTTPAAVVLATVMFLACASTLVAATVQVDYDDAIDYSKLSTFAWKEVGPDHPLAPNPLVDQQLREAIEAELVAKGFEPLDSKAEDAQPTFEIVYHASAREELRVTDWGGRGRRWGRRIDVDTYTRGTLVLDVLDGESGELVWRGAVSDFLPGPEQAEKRFRKGAAKLLKSFPPTDD